MLSVQERQRPQASAATLIAVQGGPVPGCGRVTCSRSARLLGQGWATVVPAPLGPDPCPSSVTRATTPSVTMVCSDPVRLPQTRSPVNAKA